MKPKSEFEKVDQVFTPRIAGMKCSKSLKRVLSTITDKVVRGEYKRMMMLAAHQQEENRKHKQKDIQSV